MSQTTTEKPKPRPDGSYAEPMWPGRWFDADDERLFKLDRDSKGRWFVGGGGVITITERDRWYPCVVPGLDAEAEGERRDPEGWKASSWHEHQRAEKLASERDALKVRLKVIGEIADRCHFFTNAPTEDRVRLICEELNRIASERDAALARAEKAERERDDARRDFGYAEDTVSRQRMELARLNEKVASLKSSASRPVLPEGVREWAEFIGDRRKWGEDCAHARVVARWLLDAFSSPPPETETGEAEREGPKTLSREEFEARMGALLQAAFSAGRDAADLIADRYPGEARP